MALQKFLCKCTGQNLREFSSISFSKNDIWGNNTSNSSSYFWKVLELNVPGLVDRFRRNLNWCHCRCFSTLTFPPHCFSTIQRVWYVLCSRWSKQIATDLTISPLFVILSLKGFSSMWGRWTKIQFSILWLIVWVYDHGTFYVFHENLLLWFAIHLQKTLYRLP